MIDDFRQLTRFRAYSHRDQGFNYSNATGVRGMELRYNTKKSAHIWEYKSYRNYMGNDPTQPISVVQEMDAAKSVFSSWFSLGNLHD